MCRIQAAAAATCWTRCKCKSLHDEEWPQGARARPPAQMSVGERGPKSTAAVRTQLTTSSQAQFTCLPHTLGGDVSRWQGGQQMVALPSLAVAVQARDKGRGALDSVCNSAVQCPAHLERAATLSQLPRPFFWHLCCSKACQAACWSGVTTSKACQGCVLEPDKECCDNKCPAKTLRPQSRRGNANWAPASCGGRGGVFAGWGVMCPFGRWDFLADCCCSTAFQGCMLEPRPALLQQQVPEKAASGSAQHTKARKAVPTTPTQPTGGEQGGGNLGGGGGVLGLLEAPSTSPSIYSTHLGDMQCTLQGRSHHGASIPAQL